MVFEVGGKWIGLSISLDDDQLLLTAANNSAASTTQISHTIATASRFLHVVGVVEIGVRMALYVDGSEVGSVDAPRLLDWAGSDESGIGGARANIGGNYTGLLNGFGNFSGDIALMRFHDSALSADQVRFLNHTPN